MAVPHHVDIELVPGDDWLIPGLLTDITGAPLDLTAATLEWMLLDPDGNQVTTDATITTVSPSTSGQINILVPNSVTVDLNPGRYSDALRVTISDMIATTWVGFVLVDANAFAPPPPPPPPPTSSYEDALVVVPQWWWTVPNGSQPYYPYYGGWW
jgi:hypothetical protein